MMMKISVVVVFYFFRLVLIFAQEINETEFHELRFLNGRIPIPGDVLTTGFFENGTFTIFEKNSAIFDENSLNNRVGFEDGIFKRYFAQIKLNVRENCGKEFFPHGIYIDPITESPMMYCEDHHCLGPENVQCIKNVRMSSCVASNEWIAGFIPHQNNTKINSIKVECCRYKGINEGKFIKNITFSKTEIFEHEIFVEDGKLGGIDFINNFKKAVTDQNETFYSASVYRIQCPTPAMIELNNLRTINENFFKPENQNIENFYKFVNDKSETWNILGCIMLNLVRKNLTNKKMTEMLIREIHDKCIAEIKEADRRKAGLENPSTSAVTSTTTIPSIKNTAKSEKSYPNILLRVEKSRNFHL